MPKIGAKDADSLPWKPETTGGNEIRGGHWESSRWPLSTGVKGFLFFHRPVLPLLRIQSTAGK